MPKFVCTVHLLIDAENHASACDTVSALLTEHGLYNEGAGLIDWSYINCDGRFISPREANVPADYDRDEADLDAIAKAAGGAA